MGDSVQVKYTVVVCVDPDVWMNNYGVEDTSDIETYMEEVIVEQTNQFLIRTGNVGYTTVTKR